MTTDIIVVGGGLAGSAAAICLAKSGSKVILIERSVGAHHKVCGEFLSEEALGYLHELGIEAADLGAVSIRGVKLIGRDHVASVPLPFAAMSLTRRKLDEALLTAAEQSGVKVLRGHRVEALEREGDGWRAWLDDDVSIAAQGAFLATGKHDLRGRARVQDRSWRQHAGLVGFKMYFRLNALQASRLNDHVELVTFMGGYGGLQPVEDGAANLCCLVERDRLLQIGGRWEDLLRTMQAENSHLRDRLNGAEPLLPKALAISSIPYGYTRSHSEDGLWCIGDQAAVIPSFTGDGMSIALHSARLAAAMYAEGQTPEAFQQRLQQEVTGQVRLATMISRGLVWAPARGIGVAMVQRWPGIMGVIARRTRICQNARLAMRSLAVPSLV